MEISPWAWPRVTLPCKKVEPDTVSSSADVEPKVEDPAFNVLALAAASVVEPVTAKDPMEVDARVEWPETSKLAALVAASLVDPKVVRVVAVVPAKVVIPVTVSEVVWVVLKLATLVAPNRIRFPSASVRSPVRRWVAPKLLAPVTASADAVVVARVVAPDTDSEVARVALKLATLVAPDKVKFPFASVRFPVGKLVIPKVLEPEIFKLDPVSVVKLPPPVEVTLVADNP